MATRPTTENFNTTRTQTRTTTVEDLLTGSKTVTIVNRTFRSFQRHRSLLQWGKIPTSQAGRWILPRGFAAGEIRSLPSTGRSMNLIGNRLTTVEGESIGVDTILSNIHGGLSLGTPRLPTNMIARAETEARLKLKDQKVNYGLAILEARKTFSHLGMTSAKLLSAYRYAKRRKWKRAVETLGVRHSFRGASRDVASRWLELQYAWSPLMNDIYGTYQLIQEGLRKPFLPLRVVRSVTQTDNSRRGTSSQLFVADATFGCRVTLWYYIKDEDLATAVSFGLINPAIIAWELVPFSFVVDWFAPIGNTLDALDAGVGVQFLSGTRTDHISGQGQVQWAGNQGGLMIQTFRYKSLRRYTYGTFPIPRFYLKNPFSGSHIATALALFRNLAFRR